MELPIKAPHWQVLVSALSLPNKTYLLPFSIWLQAWLILPLLVMLAQLAVIQSEGLHNEVSPLHCCVKSWCVEVVILVLIYFCIYIYFFNVYFYFFFFGFPAVITDAKGRGWFFFECQFYTNLIRLNKQQAISQTWMLIVQHATTAHWSLRSRCPWVSIWFFGHSDGQDSVQCSM